METIEKLVNRHVSKKSFTIDSLVASILKDLSVKPTPESITLGTPTVVSILNKIIKDKEIEAYFDDRTIKWKLLP